MLGISSLHRFFFPSSCSSILSTPQTSTVSRWSMSTRNPLSRMPTSATSSHQEEACAVEDATSSVGQVSPAAFPAGTSVDAITSPTTQEADYQAFSAILSEFLPIHFAQQYSTALVKNAVSFDNPIDLDRSDLQEMGVLIGHRAGVLNALQRIQQTTLSNATATLLLPSDAASKAADAHPSPRTAPSALQLQPEADEALAMSVAMLDLPPPTHSTRITTTTSTFVRTLAASRQRPQPHGPPGTSPSGVVVVKSEQQQPLDNDRNSHTDDDHIISFQLPSSVDGVNEGTHKRGGGAAAGEDEGGGKEGRSAEEDNDDEYRLELFGYLLQGKAMWLDLQGKHATLDHFLQQVHQLFHQHDIPGPMMRCFNDNKPLPFAMFLPTSRGRLVMSILLRAPLVGLVTRDPVTGVARLRSKAATLSRLTNRFVIIFVPAKSKLHRSLVLSYHTEGDIDWLRDLRAEWSGRWQQVLDAPQLIAMFIRNNSESFRAVLHVLRQEVDALCILPDTHRPKNVVEALSRIQQQAGVMRRSLTGNEKVLRTLESQSTKAVEDVPALINLVNDLRDAAEELEQHATEMLNLRLALVDFRSQVNMKVFTYMSVILQPMALVTSWYGMNFEGMAEFKIEWFYYLVIAFCLAMSLVLIAVLTYSTRETGFGAEDGDRREAAAVLAHEEA